MAARKPAKPAAAAKKKPPLKDPKGGLTAAGREHFRKTEGAHLKPGVKGPPKTPEEMKRKGSFLRRHFLNPKGPMVDENGEPTRLALSAQAWGEKLPKTEEDAKKLAAKGAKLLKQYKESQAEAAEPKATKPAAAAKPKTAKPKATKPKTAKKGD